MNNFEIIDEFGYKDDYSYLNDVINHTLEHEKVSNAYFSDKGAPVAFKRLDNDSPLIKSIT